MERTIKILVLKLSFQHPSIVLNYRVVEEFNNTALNTLNRPIIISNNNGFVNKSRDQKLYFITLHFFQSLQENGNAFSHIICLFGLATVSSKLSFLVKISPI